MSDAEFEPPKFQYPDYFDPEEYDSPEIFLRTLEDPGVVYIGPKIESEEEKKSLAELAEEADWDLGFLHLAHAEDDSRSIFPVYRVSSESVLSSPDGGEYRFRTPYPNSVTEDCVRKAEQIIGGEPNDHLSDEQKRREIIRLAMQIAGGGQVYRITDEGMKLVYDPDEEGDLLSEA